MKRDFSCNNVYNSSHVIIIKKKKHEKEHAFADIITSISFGPTNSNFLILVNSFSSLNQCNKNTLRRKGKTYRLK